MASSPGLTFVAVQAQQLLIEFADGLQSFLHLVIMPHRSANLGDLIRAETDLAGFAAGITDVEDPQGMAVALSAFGTTEGVTDGALEKRATQDIAEVGELRGKFVPTVDYPFTYHHYR
jgi:hypothetical protein